MNERLDGTSIPKVSDLGPLRGVFRRFEAMPGRLSYALFRLDSGRQ